MTEEHKKMAAAMAAVMALIRDEENLATRRLGSGIHRPAGVEVKNTWGMVGRMDLMQKNQRIRQR